MNDYNKGFEDGVRFALNQISYQVDNLQKDISFFTNLYKKYVDKDDKI